MSLFKTYKPGQGRATRTISLVSGLFLIAWGCRSLMLTLADPKIWPDGGLAWNQVLFGAPEREAWRVNLVVLQTRISPAFTLAALLVVVLSFWWWRLLNRERWADMLIEMETELRKVSWPSPSDAWQSTLVVTGFTFAVVVTILVYDVVIKGFIELCVAR